MRFPFPNSSWARLLLVGVSCLPTTVLADTEICRKHAVPVIIDASTRTLHLCEGKREVERYDVNLGAGGLGKQKEGDRKTPLGVYPLLPPRASANGFTIFVPIGYPTSEQRKLGYTGSAIGIHGPPDWLPESVVSLAFQTPWTDGCVMVRTRNDILRIRKWLLRVKASTVLILG